MTDTDAGIATGAGTTAVERGGRFRLAPPSRGQLAVMKEHHRGGIEMAAVATRTAKDRDVRALAARIAHYQRIEINAMESARQRLGLPTG